MGFLQLVGVSETDAQAEKDYAKHIEYFYHKGLHVPPEWLGIPGHQDYRSLVNFVRNPAMAKNFGSLKEKRYKDFLDDRFVVCGSPATVRDQLKDLCQSLRVGNLMVLLHIGSMPHELTLKNIDLFFARWRRLCGPCGRTNGRNDGGRLVCVMAASPAPLEGGPPSPPPN